MDLRWADEPAVPTNHFIISTLQCQLYAVLREECQVPSPGARRSNKQDIGPQAGYSRAKWKTASEADDGLQLILRPQPRILSYRDMKRATDQIGAFGKPPQQRERITLAALVIGLVVSAVLVAVTPLNDFLLMGTYIAGNHFPIGAFAVLLVLTVVVNVILRKLAPRLALAPAQLIAVWALIAIPSGIPSSGLMRYFAPGMVAFDYYASAENNWKEIFAGKINPQLLVSGQQATTGFWEGLPAGTSIPWQVWVGPVAVWGIYAFALFALMIGLSVLLRRRWVEQERFIFPLVQVPIEVARHPEGGRLINKFLRSKQVWVAVAVLMVVHTLRGLHQFYPSIPLLRTSWGIAFEESPWSYGGGISLTMYPLMTGFAYLLTSEVGFSLWFFHLLLKLQAVILGWLGAPMGGPGASYGHYMWASLEEAGATIALAIWFIWLGKNHFSRVFRKGLVGDPTVDDSDEPISYRICAWLIVGAVAVMVGWLYYFGGSLLLALINVGVGIAVFITLAWMVCQGGLIFLQPTFSATEIAASLTGSRAWPLRGLLLNLWNEGIFRMDLREYLLPSLLNALKISDPVDLHRGSLLRASAGAILLAFFVALIAAIWLPYTHGGGVALPNTWTYSSAPQIHFKWAAALSANPIQPRVRYLSHFVGGAALILVVMGLRTRSTWFALHPIGFIIGSGYPISCIWFAIFVGWLMKAAIMHWGGYQLYKQLRPFFLGLIIGDALAGAIWIVVGFVTGNGYMLLPG